MALVKCPNCNNDVSDMAKDCPSCGYELKQEAKAINTCPDCNTVLSGNELKCPKCGCPLKTSEEEIQKVEIASINIQKDKKKRKKVLITIISIFIVLAIIGGVGIFAFQKAKEEEKKRIETEYKENLKSVASDMLVGSYAAERAGGLIHDVWYNTIFKKSDSKTDNFTKKSSFTWNDFNTALKKLSDDKSFSSIIQKLKENQKTVADTMKLLTNPPEKYEDAYVAVKDYYDAYLELTDLVINPTGSLQTYTSSFNSADTNVSKCYSSVKIYIED